MTTADWVGVGVLGVVVGGVAYVVTRPKAGDDVMMRPRPAPTPDVLSAKAAQVQEAERRARAVADQVRDTGQGAANVVGDFVGGLGKLAGEVNGLMQGIGSIFGELKLFA